MADAGTVREEIPVDRDTDAYFLVLAASDDDLYRSDLNECLDQLNSDPFPFDLDVRDDYAGFMDELRLLDAMDAIEELRERRPLALTERGRTIAARLRESLDAEQAAAIAEVTA